MPLVVQQGNPSQVAPSMLALKDVLLAPLVSGTFAFVQSGVPASPTGRAIYVLVKDSGAPEDLVTGSVVAPRIGSPEAGAVNGRWLALGPVMKFMNSQSWLPV